jgi:hypothetical protein
MQKHIIYLILGIIFCSNAITFDRVYGGADEEWGFCVQQTNEGGYILAGSTKSIGNGGHDGYLIKTDQLGEIEWEKTAGDLQDDHFLQVRQTPDDGFIVLGMKNCNYSEADFWLVKYDKTGKEKWSKVYQYADSAIVGSDIEICSDGGFVIVGSKGGDTQRDLWVLKTDDRGNEEWSNSFDRGLEDYASDVIINNYGSYVIVGSTSSVESVIESFGGSFVTARDVYQKDVWVVEIIETGELWRSKIIGTKYYNDYCNSISEEGAYSYILTGSKKPFEGFAYNYFYTIYDLYTEELFLIKLNDYLNILWEKIFDGDDDEYGKDVRTTINNDLIIFGETNYGAGNYDYWLLKTDSVGNKLWKKTYGGPNYDFAGSVEITSDNGCILIGMKDLYTPLNDIYLIKTDEFGNVIYPPTITYFENDSNYVTLDWDIVSNAGSYVVYGSDRPDSNFTAIDTTAVNTWNTTTTDSTYKKFYYIKSRTENLDK